MFITEDNKARETPAERDRRRAATGMDRRGLNQAAKTLASIFICVLLLVAADVARLERRVATVTVEEMSDRGSTKRGHRCVTRLATSWGDAEIHTRNQWQYATWHVGDRTELTARMTRLTRTLVIDTRGTIFEGAYTMLPEW